MRVTKAMAARFVASVGANAKAVREGLDITQAELADRVDAWVPQVSLLEAGKRNLRLSDLYRLAVALETSPSKLVDVALPDGKGR